MITKRLTVSSLVILFAALVFLPLAAGAQRERGEALRDERRQGMEEVRTQQARPSVEELRQQRTADIEQRVEERQAQVMQDVCERRQEQFSQLIPRLSNQSTRILAAMDGVYERVDGFYESGQLTVADYESRNEAVQAAQDHAAAAVQVVVGYDFTFDCDNPSLGNQLFGFREAVSEAREALGSYRVALVDLIQSMRAAAAENAEAPVNDDENDEENATEAEDETDE